MTQTLVGLLYTHRPRGWPLAHKSLPVPGLGKVSQVTTIILPPVLKKLTLKLCNISLLLSSSLYKSLPSSYAFNYSLSLAGGPSRSRYYI
jgi:hypothetical protein